MLTIERSTKKQSSKASFRAIYLRGIAMNKNYYLIVQEPGRKLVPLEGPGSDRGIFWDIAVAERVAAALSAEATQYEFHIYRVESSNDAIKGVVARYKNGTRR
jgi:hypothetical protein